MKKKLILSGFIALLVGVSSCLNAQSSMKIGSFDEMSVVGLFPGISAKVDSVLQKYVADTLKQEYDFELEQYQLKDSLLKKDSATKSQAWKLNMKKEIAQHIYKIQNWQQYQEQMINQRQEQVLLPYKQKVYTTLEQIIKEQKYTHVMKGDVFIVLPPLDNLSIKVAQKLNLPIPKEVLDAIRQAEADAKAGKK